jgi:transcriptional regulator with XRE-family HTH domain
MEIVNNKEFCKRLETAMQTYGVTPEELAQRVGSSTQSIMKYLNGTRTPIATKITKMANAIGVPVEYLVEKQKYKTMKIYAVVNNYRNRRVAPVAIFGTESKATTYTEKIVEEHERKGESYDYDIESIELDLNIIADLMAAVDKEILEDAIRRRY